MAATTTFDPARYKAAQQRQWDAAAPGWRRWWGRIEPAFASVGKRLVDLAGISEGDRVLDVATGIGEPALTAALRVGPTGQITAIDISPGMIDIARERAANAGVANIGFRTVDAEELDYPEASFEAAVCRFGLMLFPNIGETLVRVRRALAFERIFAAALWSRPERGPLVNSALNTVMKELALPAPPLAPPGSHTLGNDRRLKAEMERAGFEDVYTEPRTVTVEFDSPEQYTRSVWETTPEIIGSARDKGPERQEQLRTAVSDALSRHAGSDGRIHLTASAVLVRGRRPARVTRKIER